MEKADCEGETGAAGLGWCLLAWVVTRDSWELLPVDSDLVLFYIGEGHLEYSALYTRLPHHPFSIPDLPRGQRAHVLSQRDPLACLFLSQSCLLLYS